MSFKDIKGHDNPIALLKKYVEEGRLAGGYLFAGPEGVGKKMSALTLAKALNCEKNNFDTSAASKPRPLGPGKDKPLSINPEQAPGFSPGCGEWVDSCDSCPSCQKINSSQHPDVHIVTNEDSDEIKIESIRQLQRQISFKPYEARKSVFIIDKAHNLNPESSNALLKILEEPPKDSLIILVTDKPGLLFKTIISRCKTIKFAALPRPQLKDVLIADFGLSNDMAHFLSYFSEGRIGYALRIKDSEIVKEKNRLIDGFVLATRFKLDALPAQDKDAVRGSLNVLATWFRDIYLLKVGMPHSELINFDRRQELLKAMGKFTFIDLQEIFDSISEAMLQLEQNINVKLMLHNLGAHIWKA